MYILHNQHSSGFDERKDERFALDGSLDEFIAAAIEQDDMFSNALERLIVLVPTARRARLVKRSVIRQAFARHGKPVSDVPVYTIEQFVRLCAQKLFGSQMPRLVSDGYTLALIEEASVNAAQRKTMRFFTSAQSPTKRLSAAVLERLRGIVLGLKEDGITPAQLRKDLDGDGEDVVDKARLADICALYEEYERLLGANLCDKPALLNAVNTALQAYPIPSEGSVKSTNVIALDDRWRELFPTTQVLFADGFTEFKQPEQTFFAALYYAPFHVRITLDYSPVNGPLFGGLDHTLEMLRGVTKTGEAIADDDPFRPHFQAYSSDIAANERFKASREEHLPLASYLRRWLFNTTDDIRHDGLNDTVNVIAFDNRPDEARSVAKLIKHLAQNDGVPLPEICVVMRQPELYTGLIREFFSLYNIPANITDRFALEKSPVATAIFATLDMTTLGFRREDVLRALQSPYLQFTRPEAGSTKLTKLDASNLFTAAERLRITGGRRYGRSSKDFWLRRLSSRLEHLRRRLLLLNQDPNADSEEIRETETLFNETERALDDFTALAAMLPEAEERMTVAEFARFVKHDIVANLGVRESILHFHEQVKTFRTPAKRGSQTNVQRLSADSIRDFLRLEEEVEQDARALAAFISVLDEMTAIAEERINTGLMGDGAQSERGAERDTKRDVERFELAELTERLRTAARSTRYQVREKLGYGVTVTTLEQIRGVPFGVTIVCGAVDGEFPARYVPESFLGKELVSSEERFLQSERIQFFQALTNNVAALEAGAKRIFITYPAAQGDTELVRSSFVDALLKITSLEQKGHFVEASALRRQPAAKLASMELWKQAIATAIASEEELLREASVQFCEVENNAANNAANTSEEYYADGKRVFERFAELATTSRARDEMKRVQEYLSDRMDKRRAGHSDSFVRVETDWNAASGVISGDSTNESVSESLPTKPFSISALEQYKKCPYQYFAQRTLNLRETLTFDSSLSPLESGSLVHRILYRFYRALQDESVAAGTAIITKAKREGIPDLIRVRLDVEREKEYQTLLRGLAEEEIEAIRFEHPFFELDKESLLGSEQKKGKLPQWLENELHRVEQGWTQLPALFEFPFGERTNARASGDEGKPTPIPPVELSTALRLRGKIDRIELGDDGTFLIGDYKTGMSGVASNADIQQGRSLQMPLYAEAARTLLKTLYGIDAEPVGMAYYLLSPKKTSAKDLKAGEKARSEQFVLLPVSSSLASVVGLTARQTKEVVKDAFEMGNRITAAVEFAEGYAQGIRGGEFDIRPDDKKNPCSTCAYKGVCRIAELKA